MTAPTLDRPVAGPAPHRVSLGPRPALDGLRGVAVLAVVAYHLRYPWAVGGFLGVDLFMVLSGFLITSLLLAEHARDGRASLLAFWARRARRIVPAVVVLVLTLAAYAAFRAPVTELRALRWDSVASLTFWANWRFVATGDGYWAQFGSPSPLTHLWSLAVEEQFYVVWPVVVIGVAGALHRHRSWLVAVCAAGIAGSAVLMAWLYDPVDPSRAYLGTDTRIHTLLVGALGAVVLRPGADRPVPFQPHLVRVGVVAGSLVLAALALVGDRSTWMYRGGFALFAIGAMLVVAAAICPSGPVVRTLGAPGLRWVGQRSFGIYLWHWPLLVLVTPERLGVDGIARDALLVAATLAIAAASFRFVEQPIRRSAGSARWTSGRTLVVTGLAIALSAGVVVAATSVPAPERVVLDPDAAVAVVPGATVPAATVPDVPEPDVPEPDGPEPDVPEPNVTGPAGTQPAVDDRVVGRRIERVLVQGDSVALFSALPVREAFAVAGIAAVDRTAYGLSLAQPDVAEAIGEVDADVSVWQISLWDVGDEDVQRARYQAFVDASLAAGMDVVFVDQPPVLISLETEERLRVRRIVREIAASDPDRVTVLDPTPVWGDTVVLDRDGDGVPERWRDEIHVCPQGAARWTAWLLDELAARYDGITPGDPAQWVNGAWLDDPRWSESPGECDPL